jgi:hypothetical protein
MDDEFCLPTDICDPEQLRALTDQYMGDHNEHDPNKCQVAMVNKLCHGLAAVAVRGGNFNVRTWCQDNEITDERMIRVANLHVAGIARHSAIVLTHLGGNQAILSAGTKQ